MERYLIPQEDIGHIQLGPYRFLVEQPVTRRLLNRGNPDPNNEGANPS